MVTWATPQVADGSPDAILVVLNFGTEAGDFDLGLVPITPWLEFIVGSCLVSEVSQHANQ